MSITRRRLLAGWTGLALGCGRKRAEGFSGYAFIANEGGGAVAVVDLGAFVTAKHIRLNGNPSHLLRRPLSRTIYAVTPASGTIHEIDADQLEVRRHLRCGSLPDAIFSTADGAALWVMCRGSRELVRIAADDFRVDARISLSGEPACFDVAPDGRRAAVGFGDTGRLALVDLDALKVYAGVTIGQGVGPVRFRSDGQVVLVGETVQRQLVILDAGTGQVIVRLPLAVRPDNFCMKQDGGQLFITGEGMDAVVTVYPYETQIASTTLAGSAPGVMAAMEAPPYLFVANPQTGDVTVLDLDTRQVMAVVAVGRYPCHIAVTPDNRYALVLNRDSGDLSVLRVEWLSGRRRMTAPMFLMVPVGSQPVSAVVVEV